MWYRCPYEICDSNLNTHAHLRLIDVLLLELRHLGVRGRLGRRAAAETIPSAHLMKTKRHITCTHWVKHRTMHTSQVSEQNIIVASSDFGILPEQKNYNKEDEHPFVYLRCLPAAAGSPNFIALPVPS